MNLMDLLARGNIIENLDVMTKQIEEGGVTLNFKRVTDPLEKIVAGGHILANNLTFVRIGKFKKVWLDLNFTFN